MLVLSRKVGEKIVLPKCGVTIGVVAVNGRKVRLGIDAPPEMSVHRKEVWHRIRESREFEINRCKVDRDALRVPISDTDSMVRQLANRVENPQECPTATESGTDWQHELRHKIATQTHGHLLDLDVEVIDECLILHGRSRSYYGKQLAYAAALEILKTSDSAPFTQVESDIRVLRSR